MQRLALLTLCAAGSCVLTRPEPDVTKVVVRMLPNELEVDVPYLGHWRKISATLEQEPGKGGQTGLTLSAKPTAGSSVLRFADVPPGSYDLTVCFGAGDGIRERTVTQRIAYETPLTFGVIARSADEDLEPRRPVLLTVPAWIGAHDHAHAELTLAGRYALERIVGPTQLVIDEADLSRFENDGVLIDKGRASLPVPAGGRAESTTPRAQVVFWIDLRLPGSSGLPCQLALSAFAVGPPLGGLWNRRNLLHQEFVPLATYELSETRNQSALLIQAVLEALRAAVRAPILCRALGRNCRPDSAEPRSSHDDLLFPPLLDPVPASKSDSTKSDSSLSDSTQSDSGPSGSKSPKDALKTTPSSPTEVVPSPAQPPREGQTPEAQATSGEISRGRP